MHKDNEFDQDNRVNEVMDTPVDSNENKKSGRTSQLSQQLHSQFELSPRNNKIIKTAKKSLEGYPPPEQQIGATSYYKLDKNYLASFQQQVNMQNKTVHKGMKPTQVPTGKDLLQQLDQVGGNLNHLPKIEQ